MEFKFRATRDKPSSHDPPLPPRPLPPLQPHSSSVLSYFADHPLRAGYVHPDAGRVGDYFPNPCSPESVLRELEKQQIRKEIIAAEVERRRQLEAEVRTEMKIERQMALRGAHGNDFPTFSGSSTMIMNHRLPISNHSKGISMDPLPFTRDSEVKISKMKASPVAKNGRVILLPKPNDNVSGVKRKVVTPPPPTATMPSIKKPKGLLKCEICQVFATSEQALEEHFQGKKHKARESRQSSQISGKNFISNPSKLVPITGSENDEGVSEKVEKDSLRLSFWCEICKIGAFTEDVMNAHIKRHNSRVAEASHNEKVPETAVTDAAAPPLLG